MKCLRGHKRIVDLEQIRQNVRAIRGAVPPKAMLMAVVKADAYGHGSVQVSRAALAAGADWLAVATVEEGIVLREAGITAPVLILGLVHGEALDAAAAMDLDAAVCDGRDILRAEKAAALAGRKARVQLKLDTGMGRVGVRSREELLEVTETLRDCPHVLLTGAFTHFADADGDGADYTAAQLERFRAWTEPLPPGVIRHCANSAAIHRLMPEAAFDMVRMGISLYGYPPVPTDLPLGPAMTWQTEITWVKEIAPGEAVSYGCTWHAGRPTRVATLACGYGDGYHRAASGRAEVLIRGKRAPVIGRICMDQMMADVTDIPGAAVGDTVTMIGRDGGEVITAEDVARWAGTISYEILLAATGRVDREWTEA